MWQRGVLIISLISSYPARKENFSGEPDTLLLAANVNQTTKEAVRHYSHHSRRHTDSGYRTFASARGHLRYSAHDKSASNHYQEMHRRISTYTAIHNSIETAKNRSNAESSCLL